MNRSEACVQGKALKDAAALSPVPMIRRELQKRATEWARAVRELDTVNGPAAGNPWPVGREPVLADLAAELSGDAATHGADPTTRAEQILEWLRPDLADPDEIEATIELVGTVGPGCQCPGGALDNVDWLDVVRRLEQNGQTSLHLSNPENGRDVYRNFMGPASPVVIRR